MRCVKPVQRAGHDGAAMAEGTLLPIHLDLDEAPERLAATYSMTSSSSPSADTTSSVDTTFGWWMRAAMRASSINVARNSRSSARCGCSRLMATVREKPAPPSSRPKCTLAIPPDAILP